MGVILISITRVHCFPSIHSSNDLHASYCFQAEDGIRDLVRSRGLGDVYKRQPLAGGKRRATTGVPRKSAVSILKGSQPAGIPSGLSLIHI